MNIKIYKIPTYSSAQEDLILIAEGEVLKPNLLEKAYFLSQDHLIKLIPYRITRIMQEVEIPCEIAFRFEFNNQGWYWMGFILDEELSKNKVYYFKR